jgi:tripartite-type tricarboxylate transporter receptor subunit TctC
MRPDKSQEDIMPLPLRKTVVSGALALVCGASLLASTQEAGAEVNFKGKVVEVILGSAAGGGTDGTTRLVGSFLEKYLPGNPTTRYRNLPGGHGAKGLNYFMKAKPDGLTWAGGASSHVDPNSLRKGVTEYDPTKFAYIGGVQRGGSIVILRKEFRENLTDKSKPPVVVGAVDGDSNWEQMITWGAELLGWNVRFVVGYPGLGSMLLAIRRGEVHMTGTSNLFALKDMLAGGDFIGVAQLGAGASTGDDIGQRSEFEKIPTFNALVQGKPSGLSAEAFEFWNALNDMDKWYALPPGTPKEILDTYRAAWNRMIKDPEFIQRGKLLFSADFKPVDGQHIADVVDKTAYPKADVVAFMDQLKAKNGLPAEPLSEEDLAALAKAKGLDRMDVPTVKAVLLAVGEGGRDIEFAVNGATKKIEVSSTRTNVSIGGKKVARTELKPGVACTIEFVDGAKEANGVTCP